MDLIELGKKLAALGLPLLGAALPLPGGAALGTALAASLGLADASPGAIASAVVTPEAIQKAQEFQALHAERMLDMTTKAEISSRQSDSADIAVINQTMIAEAKSEHWLQWAWRPLNGLALALGSFATVIGVLALAAIAISGKDPNAMNLVPTVVTSISMVLGIPGAVCGIASWHRGVMQRIEAGASK